MKGGKILTAQERKAIKMAIDDNKSLDVENWKGYYEHDMCGITTGRSGRDIAWANSWDGNSECTHRYVDTFEPLTEEQAADELE